MSTEELLKKIPKNYKEVNYLKYIQIMQLANELPEGDFDIDEWNSYVQYAMLSILLDISITELTALPATIIIGLLTTINFMNVSIVPVKCNLEIKTINEITYDEWVSFNKLIKDNQHWNNMPNILNLLIKNKTPADIEQLSIYEVMQFFFALTKLIQKSLRRFQISLAWKVIKQTVKQMITKVLMKLKVIPTS